VAAVVWTPQALDDLEAICLYVARDTPRLAQVFAERAFRATERLADFPRSGRVVPEIDRQEIREVILLSYRIIYRFAGQDVQILTVHHGARPIDRGRV
jgi:addiction module RelE/StbE family toxin